jgi:hypothetical protein
MAQKWKWATRVLSHMNVMHGIKRVFQNVLNDIKRSFSNDVISIINKGFSGRLYLVFLLLVAIVYDFHSHHAYTWNREHNTISLSFLFEQRKHRECKNVTNLNMQNYNHTCGLYECVSWYPILRERHRLRVFENRVLWSIFGRKKQNKKFWEELICLLSLRKSLIWSKKSKAVPLHAMEALGGEEV